MIIAMDVEKTSSPRTQVHVSLKPEFVSGLSGSRVVDLNETAIDFEQPSVLPETIDSGTPVSLEIITSPNTPNLKTHLKVGRTFPRTRHPQNHDFSQIIDHLDL
jgi:hypothetical protein